MASMMATIRGLTARNVRLILAQSGNGGMRALTRMAWGKGVNTMGGGAVRTFVESGSAGYYTGNFPRMAAQRQTRSTYIDFRSWKIASSRTLPRFRSRLFHTTRTRHSTSNPKITHNAGSSQESLSLGQRLRKLSREYGWSALGIYLVLSALDFPFCYLLVGTLGVERIGEWEHIVVSNVSHFIPESVKMKWRELREYFKQVKRQMTDKRELKEHAEITGWGVEEAEARNKKDASLAAQLALAYAIHKSFMFVRVPITAAITPKVVKVLRGWGWDIGKRTTKAARAVKRSTPNP